MVGAAALERSWRMRPELSTGRCARLPLGVPGALRGPTEWRADLYALFEATPYVAPRLTLNAGKLKLTYAIQSLDLPSRLAFRLARALDVGLRHRSAGDKTLRRTVVETAAILYSRIGDAPGVVGQMRETVISHLEERGVRQSSVLAVAPVPVVFAAEIAEIVARSLGIAGSHGDDPPPKARVARWIERARDLRKPTTDEPE